MLGSTSLSFAVCFVWKALQGRDACPSLRLTGVKRHWPELELMSCLLAFAVLLSGSCRLWEPLFFVAILFQEARMFLQIPFTHALSFLSFLVLLQMIDANNGWNYVYIKKLGNACCPFTLLERYITLGVIDISSTVALFRSVRLFKSTNTYKLHGDRLSYTRCREIMLMSVSIF